MTCLLKETRKVTLANMGAKAPCEAVVKRLRGREAASPTLGAARRPRSFLWAWVWTLVLPLSATQAVARQALTVRLIPDAPTVQQGDTLRFDLRFLNTGSSPVSLWAPLDWGSRNEPTMRLMIRAENGADLALGPAQVLQGLYIGPEEYVVLAPGDSASVRLGIGEEGGPRTNPRRVTWWRLIASSHSALSARQSPRGDEDVWVGFAGPGEYTVSVDYDLRHAPGPLYPSGSKPDSNWTAPLLRKLLHAGPVRVVVTERR